MREAYCWHSNDAYKNSRSSRIEKEWLGESYFPLRFSMTRSLTFFADIFLWSLNSAGRDTGFFRLRISSKSSVEIRKTFWKKLLYCIKLHDRGKLETREDTCTGQVNQYKDYPLQGRSQERFGRLARWLGPWEGIRQDHSTDRPRPGGNRTWNWWK